MTRVSSIVLQILFWIAATLILITGIAYTTVCLLHSHGVATSLLILIAGGFVVFKLIAWLAGDVDWA